MLSWEQEIQGTRLLENQKNYLNQGNLGTKEPKELL